MKKEISPAILIGAVVVVLALVVFFGYRVLNPPIPTRHGYGGKTAGPAPVGAPVKGRPATMSDTLQ